MCDLFRNEFNKERVLFSTDEPWKLATSQNERHHVLYLVYRLVMCLCWIAMMLYVAITEPQHLMFMTLWVFMGTGLSATLQLLTALHWHLRKGDCVPNEERSKTIPVLYKVNWGFYSTFSSFAILVSSVFWIALAFGSADDDEQQKERQEMTFFNVAVHMLNIVYVLSDLFITGVPVRLLHVWMPQLLQIVYASTYILYWKLTGYYAYPEVEVEFSLYLVGIILALLFLFIPFFHILLFCIYIAKIKLYRYCYSETFNLKNEASDRAANITYIA